MTNATKRANGPALPEEKETEVYDASGECLEDKIRHVWVLARSADEISGALDRDTITSVYHLVYLLKEGAQDLYDAFQAGVE